MRELTHLSYSSVSLWHHCPRAWYLKYRLGIVDPPSTAQIFGTAMHNTVQHALVTKSSMMAAADTFEDYFIREMRARNADISERDYLYHIALAEDTLRDPFSNEIFKSISVGRRGQVEQKIEFFVPGVPIPVVGYIDIVDDNGAVYDIKTSRSDWAQSRADEEQQVDFYLTALDLLGDHRHGGHFTYIIMTKIRPAVYLLDTHREGYQERVFKLVRDVWEHHEGTPARDDYLGERCNRCWSVQTCALNPD